MTIRQSMSSTGVAAAADDAEVRAMVSAAVRAAARVARSGGEGGQDGPGRCAAAIAGG